MPGQPFLRHMQTHRHRQAGETGIGLPKAHYNLQCLPTSWGFNLSSGHSRLRRPLECKSIQGMASHFPSMNSY